MTKRERHERAELGPVCDECAAPIIVRRDLDPERPDWWCPLCGKHLPRFLAVQYGRGAATAVARVELIPCAGSALRLAIVREDPRGEGMSITNGAEEIAGMVCRAAVMRPDRLVYLEHLERGGGFGGCPTWDFVTFKADRDWRFSDPEWRPAGRADFALLGVPDPRRFPVEVINLNGGGTLYRVFGPPAPDFAAAPAAERWESRELVAWFCDLPALHGGDAFRRLCARLRGLHAGDMPPRPPEIPVGAQVVYYRDRSRYADGGVICGRGVLSGRTTRGGGRPSGYLVRTTAAPAELAGTVGVSIDLAREDIEIA